jgi:hypothetical protein
MNELREYNQIESWKKDLEISKEHCWESSRFDGQAGVRSTPSVVGFPVFQVHLRWLLLDNGQQNYSESELLEEEVSCGLLLASAFGAYVSKRASCYYLIARRKK